MTECLFCKGNHEHTKCPLFGDTKSYLQHHAPKPPILGAPPVDERPRSSLAPTQFEEAYGKGAEEHLQEVIDHPDQFTHEEVNLAWQILEGVRKISTLTPDEKDLLNHITRKMIERQDPKPLVIPPTLPLRERRHEDDEGPPRDEDYESLVTKGQVDPSDG